MELVNCAYHESDADRKMLERSLELSSQELLQANGEMRAIFEAVPDFFFRLDISGTILDCRVPDASDFFILLPKLIGKKIYDIPSISDSDKFRKAVEDLIQTQNAVSFEYFLAQDKAEIFFQARWIPLMNDQIVVVIRNITGRKKAEKDLINSEAFFRAITHNSSDIIIILDKIGMAVQEALYH